MVELVTFGDVEAMIVAYMQPLMQGVSVRTRVRNPREASSIRVQSMGGQRSNMVLSERMIVVQCWDVSEPASARLAERASAVLFAAPRQPDSGIRRVVSVGEPASFPDPETSLPRYQFTVAVTIRATVSTT